MRRLKRLLDIAKQPAQDKETHERQALFVGIVHIIMKSQALGARDNHDHVDELQSQDDPDADSSTGTTSRIWISERETLSLLRLLDTYKPLAREEWEHVIKLQNEAYPGDERTSDSLKRKFAKLYRQRIPTGDPLIPKVVKFAKAIRNDMTQRADISDGEDAATEAARAFSSPSPLADTLDMLFTLPSTPLPAGYSPRPLVGKRVVPARSDGVDEDDAFLATLKVSMQQEQARAEQARVQHDIDQKAMLVRWELKRNEQRERREEERKARAAQRAEERERREEEHKKKRGATSRRPWSS